MIDSTQEVTVEPVVRISSTISMCFPFSLLGFFSLKAFWRLDLLSVTDFFVCEIVFLILITDLSSIGIFVTSEIP